MSRILGFRNKRDEATFFSGAYRGGIYQLSNPSHILEGGRLVD